MLYIVSIRFDLTTHTTSDEAWIRFVLYIFYIFKHKFDIFSIVCL